MDILNLEPNEDDEYAEDAEEEALLEEEQAGLLEPSRLEKVTKRKSFKIGLGVATLYTLVLIGETIGALVTLNGAKPLEYGQGVTAAVSCDPDGLQVEAIGRTENPTTTTDFYLDGIKISGVADSCINKVFKIAIYDASGNVVNVGYKGASGSREDAKYAKVSISRQNNDSGGADWRVFPATSLPYPATEDGLTMCGGLYDLSDQINYDFGTSVPKPGCPTENYLTHWQGYMTVPGVDDGNEHAITFSMNLTGQARLIIGGDDVFYESGDGTEKTVTGTYSMLRGSAYPFDLWAFHGAGTAKNILSWDASGSDAVVPAEVFQWDSSLQVRIPSGEVSPDYTVSSVTSSPNDRNFILHFNRAIPTDRPRKFTIETSRT